ncbi:unnamed protein product [Macrosiphum euphorbiae]|uniref:Uncharacterized protein n=1 Tax=Macrosiphum euphorbiae TaxID=13131 RepID=A0AAV0XEZ4_9HEMI|nr:unnamed protein product [Macrosiphum euphorbiae]
MPKLPNIHVWFCRKGPSRELSESSESGNVCAITNWKIEVHSTSSRRFDKTEPVTEDVAKPKRKTIWKRTKKKTLVMLRLTLV